MNYYALITNTYLLFAICLILQVSCGFWCCISCSPTFTSPTIIHFWIIGIYLSTFYLSIYIHTSCELQLWVGYLAVQLCYLLCSCFSFNASNYYGFSCSSYFHFVILYDTKDMSFLVLYFLYSNLYSPENIYKGIRGFEMNSFPVIPGFFFCKR